MEKIDNIEFYISCYFGVILSTICQVLRHFTWMSSNMHGGRKPTETFVTEFCYKSVNLFFEKLISIKVILFLIHELFR